MKQKVFDQPKPVYSYEGEKKSKTKILDARHISCNRDKTRKVKRTNRLSRPFLIKHANCNDAHCKTCADYINKLQAWRKKN